MHKQHPKSQSLARKPKLSVYLTNPQAAPATRKSSATVRKMSRLNPESRPPGKKSQIRSSKDS